MDFAIVRRASGRLFFCGSHMSELIRKPAGGTVRRSGPAGSGGRRSLVLNIFLVVLIIAVAVFGYSFVVHLVSPRTPGGFKNSESTTGSSAVVQIDVLNGCGSPGAATSVSMSLRSRGYDVVEVRNYRTLNVDETFVIDRTGDLEYARRVATALGVKPDKILQRLNPDYYVDVSVVVGRDFHSLKLSQ